MQLQDAESQNYHIYNRSDGSSTIKLAKKAQRNDVEVLATGLTDTLVIMVGNISLREPELEDSSMKQKCALLTGNSYHIKVICITTFKACLSAMITSPTLMAHLAAIRTNSFLITRPTADPNYIVMLRYIQSGNACLHLCSNHFYNKLQDTFHSREECIAPHFSKIYAIINNAKIIVL